MNLCKDVLQFLKDVEDGKSVAQDGYPYTSATWFWDDTYKPSNSVMNILHQHMSILRGRALLRLLGRRGLVEGCHCGCRGEFLLTSKGRSVLNESL